MEPEKTNKVLGPLSMAGVVIAGIVLILFGVVAWGVSSYNSLVNKQEDIENAWAEVENQYQIRFNKFQSLEDLGSAALKQERDIFFRIAEAREAYAGAETQQEKIDAMNQYEADISSGVSAIMVVVEDNPEIKSQETLMQIIYEVAGAQNQVGIAVRRYNDAVTNYNKAIKTIPTKFIAGMFGFTEDYERVEAPEEVKENPDINL